jgi:hypothetical protein
MTDQQERELCHRCEGNGLISIPGGVSVCPRCRGEYYEPQVDSLATVTALEAERDEARRERDKFSEAMQTFAKDFASAESALATLQQQLRALEGEIAKACDTAMRMNIPTRELVGRIRAALLAPPQDPQPATPVPSVDTSLPQNP